jgi:hypothetical protein
MILGAIQVPCYSQDVNAHGGTPERGSEGGRPVTSPSEVIDVTNDYLVPANTKGNPGFTYAISSANQNGSSASGDSSCQGTLISAANNVCVVATAAHCLYPQMIKTGIKNLPENFCGTTNGIPAKSGEVSIETADFGKVKAQAIVHPHAKSDGSDLHDVGILKFSCPEGAKNVPVVKVASSPMQPDEDIWYGKVKGAKGLWTGRAAKDKVTFKFKSSNGETRTQTYDNTLYEDKRQSDNTRHVVVQNSEHSAQTGDSGGPALAERDGEKVLIGILSGTPGVISAAIYQTNSSMDFIKCFAEKKTDSARALAEKPKPASDEKPSSSKQSGTAPQNEQAGKQEIASGPTQTQAVAKAQSQPSVERGIAQGPKSPPIADQNPSQQHCEDGVCKVGPKPVEPQQAGLTPDFFGRPSNPGEQGVQGPLVEQGTPEPRQSVAQQPSAKPTQGFKEVQATDDASFKQALRQARADGVKHVVVRYGNDDTCELCRVLRDDLKNQLGNDGEVRVIKMPEWFKPNAAKGIPQSKLLTQIPGGNWSASATRIGSTETAGDYKAEIERLRQRQSPSNIARTELQPQPEPQPQLRQSAKPQAPEIAEGAKKEFPSVTLYGDEMEFYKTKNGNLVRKDPKGNLKIPRLQEMPDGKRELVYDAHSGSPVPFERASKTEREAFRDYYLAIKEGDKKSWEKYSPDQKGLINGFLANWTENDNKIHWERTSQGDKKTTGPKETIPPTPATQTAWNPATAKTFNVKDLIPAATKAGKIAAEFTANQIFPEAGTAARVMGPKALEAMKALPGPNGFFGATPEKTVKNYNIDFFQSLKNGEKFQIDGIDYKATGPGKRTYSARSPAGPFGLEVPTEKGTVKIRIEGFGSARKVYVD